MIVWVFFSLLWLAGAKAAETDASVPPLRAPLLSLNIKMPPYRAKGDGSTDDSLAVQTALNSLTPGRTLYFPAGRYALSRGLTNNISDITLYGEGTLSHVDNTTAFWLLKIMSGVSNITITGLTFDGNRTGYTKPWTEHRHALTIVDSTHVSIIGCVFTNLIGDGIYAGCDAPVNNIFIGVSDLLVANNVFTGENINRNGISVICGERITISNNTFDGMATQVMPGAIDFEPDASAQFIRDVTVIGNNVTRCRAGILFRNISGIKPSNFSGMTIVGNTISEGRGNTTDGGIGIKNAYDVLVQSNVIRNMTNNGAGISIGGGAGIVLDKNFVKGGKGGISIQGSPGIVVMSNDLAHNYGGGWMLFTVEGCRSARITDNRMTDWGVGNYGLYLIGNNSGSVIENNIFDGLITNVTAIGIRGASGKQGIGYNTFKRCWVGVDKGL